MHSPIGPEPEQDKPQPGEPIKNRANASQFSNEFTVCGPPSRNMRARPWCRTLYNLRLRAGQYSFKTARTGAKLRRCCGLGPCTFRAARCALVG